MIADNDPPPKNETALAAALRKAGATQPEKKPTEPPNTFGGNLNTANLDNGVLG
jgi:hypothetical protein